MIRRILFLVPIALLAGMSVAAPRPVRLATLAIPGPGAFARVARDVLDVAFTLDPSLASGSGLFDDSVRVPTYSSSAVKALDARLLRDLGELHRLRWDALKTDEQIDVRWVYAYAEGLHHQLITDRMFVHRPGQWLEPVANNLINLETYAPGRAELQQHVLDLVPEMAVEMRIVLTAPTERDLKTGRELVGALQASATAQGHAPAMAALTELDTYLGGLHPTQNEAVVGAESYAWRYSHALLFPFSPEQLLLRAQGELTRVDAEIAALAPPPASVPTADEAAASDALTREGMLALYDHIEEAHRAAIVREGWVSIPDGVGPIKARETPAGMIPLTGDGGSMNPPPTYWSENTGYWNVQHFNPAFTHDERLAIVRDASGFLDNGMGTYSAHEGFPGHHLQLSIARLHPDPLRSVLSDCPENEGWALYSEEAFYLHHGLGNSDGTRSAVLGGYRSRIRRVVYDVNIESGLWSVQDAADWKTNAEKGKGVVDPDVLRSINWPTQLVCYFGGKSQILDLRAKYQEKLGAAYSDRAFHDALLREGSIPIALTAAKMLGEPIPPLPELPK